ncbi:glucose-1-phosphate thymidylyltransferase [Streptomyces phyllanthi]|uniref:Glucose-1-phosphate thymidylyltransferase n=1 Tax=Streptomyces phyllanthi TaxID=1803180 RepID=A0A5N8W760_9ACTN|nr:glucose-1-phosphate thymidylyltransferase [Streptomyces phyllanthi]MPY43317.1 glucose-1-phosphate thymidylyltransferase [Streptomyces phyllanthi]
MKALVLAGDSGTRLRTITHSRAKQLVPIANRPVLFYGLESIAEAGIEEVGIVVGQTASEIEEVVGDGSAFGLRVTYIRQSEPLGLAHAVLVAREFLGDDDFVMYLGDNFVIGGIAGLVEDFRRLRPEAHMLLTRVSDPSSFGVAELDHGGNVVRLKEKPEHHRSDLALVGVYMFTPAVHEAVDAIKPSSRGELEITDALQWLIDQGRDVRSSVIDGYWKDTGNVSDMLEANRVVLQSLERRIDGEVDDTSQITGRVHIDSGAQVRNSRIIGPVTIGADTVIEDSYVGPFTSVDHSCVIHSSEIEFSIVLPEASIQGVGRIEASLIGRQVQVAPSPRAPSAHRLVLGDHSKVQIRP